MKKEVTVLSTRTHGVIDYFMFIVLGISPWLFGYAAGGAETTIPVVIAIAGIIASLMTDYELGAFHVIPMRIHLTLDVIAGLFLAFSPWLFGFSDTVWVPHLLFGAVETVAGLFTSRVPSYRGTSYY